MFLSQKSRAEAEHNRFDIKNRRPTPPDAQQQLICNMQRAAAQSDALIVLDQLTEPDAGVVTAQMRAALAGTAQKYPELLIFADSRAFADEFTGVTIKCNDKEAVSYTHLDVYKRQVQYLRFVGDSSTVTSQRSEGMDGVLGDNFNQVAETLVTNWSTEEAQGQMEDWLNAHSVEEIEALDLIVTHDDEIVDLSLIHI